MTSAENQITADPGLDSLRGVGRDAGNPIEQMGLPLRDLIGMNVAPSRELGDGLLALDGG